MTGKPTKQLTKKAKSNEPDSNQSDSTLTEQTTLLDIKRELNSALRELFEEQDYRLTKIEDFLSLKGLKGPVDYPKAPEYCYN